MNNYDCVNESIDCCGCGICYKVCPKNAIEMKENEYGFIFPYINKEKCINCGLCKKICAYKNIDIQKKFPIKVYGFQSKNYETQNKSSSGGAFYHIANNFIKNGGIVYGVEMQIKNNMTLITHTRIDNIKDLSKIQGSKYVQSNMYNILSYVKKDLNNNKKVLFSGTPCQIAALLKYTKNNDNLYTIDIICHGVPNNKMFNDYINTILINKEGIDLTKFNFRFKNYKKGSLNYNYNYNYKGKQFSITNPSFKSSFYQLFLDSQIYRENCYSCKYASKERVSDITIGDYWGIEIEHPDLKSIDINKGISCILVNTNKGIELLNKIKDEAILIDSTIEKVSKHNKQLNNPSVRRKNYNELMNLYKNNGYKEIDKYYKNKNFIKNSIKFFITKLPMSVRKIIKH